MIVPLGGVGLQAHVAQDFIRLRDVPLVVEVFWKRFCELHHWLAAFRFWHSPALQLSALPGVQRLTSTLVMKSVVQDRPFLPL